MAQSNYNIPNSSAPAVRAQLNAVFASIASNNSGATAPSTTFAYQWWYDTSANILKQRNAADDGWINIGTFDQTGGTFSPFGVAQLTQGQAEDPASTVFGTVSGQRLEQQTNAAFNVSGSAPKYACRAWVSVDGVTASTIRGSGNVSSVTRTAAGRYTVNFATAMPDTNYAVAGSAQATSGNFSRFSLPNAGAYSTTSVDVASNVGDSTASDTPLLSVAVFR